MESQTQPASIEELEPGTFSVGNFGPVLTEVTHTELTVSGKLPKELNGRLLRDGPNPVVISKGSQPPSRRHCVIVSPL